MKIETRSERSAELYSAVSRICNPLRWRNSKTAGNHERLAECNSAIRQIEKSALRRGSAPETTGDDDPRGEEHCGSAEPAGKWRVLKPGEYILNMKIETRSERSAELHSAVSQIFNLRCCRNAKAVRVAGRFAGCNPAIRQIENLRYDARQALLHFQSSGAAHSRAFTGLFTT